jgi:hypothetical protein
VLAGAGADCAAGAGAESAGAGVESAGAGVESAGAGVESAGAGCAALDCAGAAVCDVVDDALDGAGALASDVTELAAAPAEPTVTVVEEPDGLELGALVGVELPPLAPEPVELWLLACGEASDDTVAVLEDPVAASAAPPALDPAATVTLEPLDWSELAAGVALELCGLEEAWELDVVVEPEPEPAESEPVEPEPAEPDPAEPDPAEPEPAEPEPAEAWSLPGLALAPPVLVVCADPGPPCDCAVVEVSADVWALVLAELAVLRVVIAVLTLLELHTRPCGCSLRILLISESIFEPEPIGPVG